MFLAMTSKLEVLIFSRLQKQGITQANRSTGANHRDDAGLVLEQGHKRSGADHGRKPFKGCIETPVRLLQDLKERLSLSYLFISHDLAVVRYFCQRVAIMYLGKFVEQGTVNQIFDDPLHPYTITLRDASPIPDPAVKQEFAQLKGEVPSPISPPRGCHFHPRCPRVKDICSREYPVWTELDDGRGVACHLYN